MNSAGLNSVCLGSLIKGKSAFPPSSVTIREGSIIPQHHELPVLDGLLVGRAVLLLAGGKHGAAAKSPAAAEPPQRGLRAAPRSEPAAA